MIQAVDKDQNGVIDVDEFTSLMKQRVKQSGGKSKPKTYKEELRAAFSVFDVNNDGEISAKELSSIMKALGEKLSEEDVKFMLSEVDENSDGVIDFGEFQKMMCQGPISK